MSGPGDAAAKALGEYLRTQRHLAKLSLRQLSELASVSNPYLSQVERGLHQPSIHVLTSIAQALNLSADALLAQAAGLDGSPAGAPAASGAGPEHPSNVQDPTATELAIRADRLLDTAQKEALLAVYRTLTAGAGGTPAVDD